MRVLILCTGNSARSQMAEAILRSMDPTLDVHSAGTRPAGRVHPGAVAAMGEIGIDISGAFPKSVDQFLNESFDWVITVCDHARETCPIFTGRVRHRLHIGFDDPAAVQGSAEEVLAAFRRVRDEIRSRLANLFPEIRPASAADREGVSALLMRHGLGDSGLADQFGANYVLAVLPSGVVGVVGVERHGPYGLLRSVAVEADLRGQGLAERLVRNRLDYARIEGLREVYLLTTDAAGYFERLGFARVARESVPPEIRSSHQFAVACPSSSVVMVRSLE